jgi:formate/nitrite transporter FocA (FNT family)
MWFRRHGVAGVRAGYDSAVNSDTIVQSPDDGDSSTSKQLSERERREVKRRAPLRAAVVFETIRQEGQQELERPFAALSFSGLAAGLSMGFSLVASGMIRAAIPAAVPWRGLLENLGYTLGFLIVVLGRQQLFTENTVTAIVPFLDDPNKRLNIGRVLRLWGIVFASNIIGALLFAEVVAHTSSFTPELKTAFLELGTHTLSFGFMTTLVRGIFAGWLIALMVWLLPSAENSRVSVIIIITYVVGAAGLSHVIAGSVEALYAVVSNAASWNTYIFSFLIPVFIGNSIGGVLLVSMLNYAQIAPENAENEAQGDAPS